MFDKDNTKLGIFILYVTIIFSILIWLKNIAINKYSLLEISFYLVNILLAYAIAKGKNWARYLLSINYLICVPFFLGPIGREFARLSLIGVTKFLLLTLICYSIILLSKKAK